MISRETVLSDVIGLIEVVTGDWETPTEIHEHSSLLKDLGLESIEVVALGTGIEEKYQRPLPFAQFLVELGEQERSDFTIGQLADFVTEELNAADAGAAR